MRWNSNQDTNDNFEKIMYYVTLPHPNSDPSMVYTITVTFFEERYLDILIHFSLSTEIQMSDFQTRAARSIPFL